MALEDHKLPEDVKIGHITFHKGTSLATFASRAEAWWREGRAEVLDEAIAGAVGDFTTRRPAQPDQSDAVQHFKARQLKEPNMSTATAQIPRMNMRQRRAESLASGVMQALDDYLPSRHRREAYDALRTMFMSKGVEVLTDFDREQVGLPPRGDEGWSVEELLALERLRLDTLTKPMSPIIISK